jgi:hyperosmotically inducible protein
MLQPLQKSLEGMTMFRTLLRLVLLIVIVVAAAAYFLGWYSGGHGRAAVQAPAIGTSGHVDASRAREAGAKVGETAADAANRAGELLSDGSLTAKIKSKMALDDTVQSRSIDVSTTDHVVTLTGTVRSQAERERAVQLARETAGVTRVVDNLKVGR